MQVDGGCHCGYITYEAEVDPEKVTLCHCTDCQTLSGSAFRTIVLTRENGFKLRSGKPKTYVKTSESGNKRLQAFCPECGTSIYSCVLDDAPKFHNIRVGSVRQRAQLVPKAQIWCRSQLPWLADLETIRKSAKQ